MDWNRLLRWRNRWDKPLPFLIADEVSTARQERAEAERLDLTGVEEPTPPWEEPAGSYRWPEGTAEWEPDGTSSLPPPPKGWPDWTADPPPDR